MKELETQYLYEVGGGLNGPACEADALGGFGIGATVGGGIGLAAGPAGGAIGAAVGGLVGGAVAVSDNANCGTGDGSAAAASASSASCSSATSCCADGGDSGGGGGGGGGGKVICTELCRVGEIDHEVWLADIRYSRQNSLSEPCAVITSGAFRTCAGCAGTRCWQAWPSTPHAGLPKTLPFTWAFARAET